MVEVRRLTAAQGRLHVSALAAVLLDCVQGGASVSFMAELTSSEAEHFFAGALAEVEQGQRVLLAAFAGTQLVGTVQVQLATPQNQPHRADVAKLLVARAARSQGVGAQLMRAAEDAAREAGKSLLVLDTVAGESGEKLYRRLGWTAAGVIPRYALFPDGRWCDAVIFWKWIE